MGDEEGRAWAKHLCICGGVFCQSFGQQEEVNKRRGRQPAHASLVLQLITRPWPTGWRDGTVLGHRVPKRKAEQGLDSHEPIPEAAVSRKPTCPAMSHAHAICWVLVPKHWSSSLCLANICRWLFHAARDACLAAVSQLGARRTSSQTEISRREQPTTAVDQEGRPAGSPPFYK